MTVDNDELLISYIDYLENRSLLSNNSKYAYSGDARRYIVFLGNDPATGATKETILKLIETMVRQGRSNSSIQRQIVGVRSFYKFLESEGLIDYNPVKDFTTAAINGLVER